MSRSKTSSPSALTWFHKGERGRRVAAVPAQRRLLQLGERAVAGWGACLAMLGERVRHRSPDGGAAPGVSTPDAARYGPASACDCRPCHHCQPCQPPIPHKTTASATPPATPYRLRQRAGALGPKVLIQFVKDVGHACQTLEPGAGP